MKRELIWDTQVVIRRIRVNYNRMLLQELDILEALGGKKIIFINPEVLFSFPLEAKGEQEVEVVFFHLIGHKATQEEINAQREALGLVEDAFAQLAVNEADLGFADKYDNAITWKDDNGRSCYLSMLNDPETCEQYIFMGYKPNNHWFGTSFGGWWFAGARKA